jgi:NADPH-dependent curcumin reductase CurA
MTRTNTAWLLKRRPATTVARDDLELVSLPVPELRKDQVLIRNVYLSLDPTNRLWMSDRDQYLPPVEVGDVMRGSTIGVVEESASDRFASGDFVIPTGGGWQEYAVFEASLLRPVHRHEGVPLTAYLSVLGLTGVTAYFGVTDVCRPQEGETLVVSAAAGAVGSVAGQLAKVMGCRVIGIAGGPEKCRWIVDDLGFDGAIDYKSESVGEALDRICPEGVDINFENVGGRIMDDVFSRLNTHGRMALCGMISGYNQAGPLAGPTDFGRILMHRLTVRGFVVIDYYPRMREALTELGTWVSEGRLKWKDHVIDGLDQAPSALERLFRGDHDGKLIVRVSAED